jgi:TonB-dependent SusC/RagA subfamily outer membrane receptor
VLRRHVRALASLLPLALASVASAQEAVTITGHISAASMPVRGAAIRIPELDLGAVSDAEGRYSFIVPSTRVRGQTVTLTVRYLRYRTESVSLTLVGGAVVQDFALQSSTGVPARPDSVPARIDRAPDRDRVTRASPTGAVRPGTPTSAIRLMPPVRSGRLVDSSAFLVAAGPMELPALLAGRLAGLDVRSAASAGGSVALQLRGRRTLLGLSEPLFVVDGVLLDNESITTSAQRLGVGGLDVGGPLNAFDASDIASIELLTGADAAMRYGGRAANGVLVVTTRSARGLGGFAVSASQQVSFESPLRLPEYQNAYGQGLGGAFAFFDGRGGGVNDSVSQSWGPALDGRPVIQASLTEARRPEVRAFLAHPDNVRDYFDRGRVLTTSVAAQGASETQHFRLSATNRSTRGLTPETSLSRQSVALTGGTEPTPRSALNASLRFSREHATDLPGTGFDESNPVSMFAVTPRQVDISALRTHLRDAAGNQINWNYRSHDNPYFTALENANLTDRTQLLGSLSGTVDLSPGIQASAVGGIQRASQSRSQSVASGYIGGFPFFSGRSDSTGTENDDITRRVMNVDAGLRAAVGATPFAVTVGLGARSSSLDVERGALTRGIATTVVSPPAFNGDAQTLYVRGGVEASLGDAGTVVASARRESSTLFSSSVSTVYPSVTAALDLGRLMPESRALGNVSLHAGWSRSGSESLPVLWQRLGVRGLIAADSPDPMFAQPEITTGWEVGVGSRSAGRRVELDVRAYHELSEQLLLPMSLGLVRGGSISNSGLEAQVTLVPLRVGESAEWRIGLNWARNSGRVESLGSAGTTAVLASGPGGLLVQARVGEPLASITGTRFRRDAAGGLLLRDGVPLPDVAAGAQLLGSSAPDWIGGATSSLRYRSLEVSVLVDARVGGKVFSVSNQAGAYAGVLAETAFRPDSGLLLAGTDVVTGASNLVHASTEAYYHALGGITERWVYDASYAKLREARLDIELPVQSLPYFRGQSARLTFIGRNLALWSKAPNIDPETVLSTSPLSGVEMGQLPTARSLGVQLTLAP